MATDGWLPLAPSHVMFISIESLEVSVAVVSGVLRLLLLSAPGSGHFEGFPNPEPLWLRRESLVKRNAKRKWI